MALSKAEKELMKNLIFAAVALAAGLSPVAAFAEPSDRATEQATKPAATAQVRAKPKSSAEETKPTSLLSMWKASRGEASDAAPAEETEKADVTSKKSTGKPAGSAKTSTTTTKKTTTGYPAEKRVRVTIDTKSRSTGALEAFGPAPKAQSAPRSARAYSEIVSKYAASYGVPVDLAHAVISVESNYRVDALGSAGEIGLMQIKPATARMLGYSGSTKGLYDPSTNIRFGMKYLSMAHKLGGGAVCGTILRYNAGHAATRMNPISSAYCTKVKRLMAGA